MKSLLNHLKETLVGEDGFFPIGAMIIFCVYLTFTISIIIIGIIGDMDQEIILGICGLLFLLFLCSFIVSCFLDCYIYCLKITEGIKNKLLIIIPNILLIPFFFLILQSIRPSEFLSHLLFSIFMGIVGLFLSIDTNKSLKSEKNTGEK